MQDGRLVYRLMGEGDLPIADMMMALRSINYEGYVSLEWVQVTGMPDLYDAGIVFPQYMPTTWQPSWIQPVSGPQALHRAHRQRASMSGPTNKLIDLTFPQVLDRMVRGVPRSDMLSTIPTLDYTRTYSQFRDDVDTFARALIAMGVKRGDHVAIWATNVPQWYITFWATTKIGAVLVTVNTAYKIHEAEYLLRQSRHPHAGDDRRIQGFRLCGHHQGAVPGACETTIPRRPLHTHRLPFLRNVITVRIRAGGLLLPGMRRWSAPRTVPVQEV